jgi:hypothetical protein
VSAETGLSFQDIGRMHCVRRSQAVKRRKGTPIWALNDASLREVICRYLEHRYYLPSAPHKSFEERLAICKAEASKSIPRYVELLDSLLDRQESLRSVEIQNVDSKIVLERRGFPAIVCAVVYQSYRLGWSSTQVAAETGMKPPHVRILLYRLGRVWADMQSGRQDKHFALPESRLLPPEPKKRGRRRIWTQDNAQALRLLRTSGCTWKQCGEVFGMTAAAAYGFYQRYCK